MFASILVLLLVRLMKRPELFGRKGVRPVFEPITTTPRIPLEPAAKKRPSGPRSLLPLGSAYAFGRDPIRSAVEMMHLTLRVVGQSLFTIDLSKETEMVGRAVTTLSKLVLDYMSVPFPPLWVPTPRNRRIKSALRTLDAVVQGMITARRQQHT